MEGLHLDVNGEKIPFVNVSDMTLGELRLLKETARMLPLEVEQARWVGDPDAWLGLILIAIRRLHPDTTASDLDGVNLLAAIEEVAAELARQRQAAEEEADPGPPAGQAADAAEERPETGASS